jgi:sporulation protein YlmC with PRC-barrel domain
MRIDLDAKVRTRDGEEAGSVQRAVVDPRTNEVMELVVSTGGWLGRDVLVPRTEIESAEADGGAIRLRLTKHELEALPAYVPANYVMPPVGAAMPLGYGFPESGFLWPVGFTAATGVGYVPATDAPVPGTAAAGTAAAAAADQAQVSSSAGLPTGGQNVGEASLSKGAVVIDSQGNDVGVVDDVLFDQNGGQLRGFVLRVGSVLRTLFGGGDTVEIDAAQVERVAEGIVHLRLTKDELVPAPTARR